MMLMTIVENLRADGREPAWRPRTPGSAAGAHCLAATGTGNAWRDCKQQGGAMFIFGVGGLLWIILVVLLVLLVVGLLRGRA